MVIEGILSVLLSPSCLILIVIGVIVGIIFGSIPGLSATMAIALFLPMTFGMEPVNGLSTLMALYIGGVSGGLISAILLKIPGTPSSIATVFDGGPMVDNGEANKALGVGILYSFIGGTMSFIALIFISPYLAKVALNFSSAEYFSIAVFALTIIVSLSGKSLLNGIISGLIGIMISLVGIAPIDGILRFNFGIFALTSGFDIIVLLIGFFAVSEIIKYGFNMKDESTKSKASKLGKIKGFGISFTEFKDQGINCLRSGLIGIFIGILPGIGGSTSSILSYTAAKNSSKYPEKFGTGIIDGIVASETANNATIGGALVPLLSLGIPGSAAAAMLLGGFMIHGISPGPLIFIKHGALMYGIFTSLVLANIVMIIVEFFGLNIFVKLLDIPKHILFPIIMCMCAVGAFATKNSSFEVWCIFGFGVLAYAFYISKLPTTPLIIGFILGPMLEVNLRRAMIASKGNLFFLLERPISAIFLVLALFSIVFSLRKKFKGYNSSKIDVGKNE